MWRRAFHPRPVNGRRFCRERRRSRSDRATAADLAMNSSASWNAGGLSPELYQAAREAAQRAGMSVEDWLRSTFGDSAVASMRPQTAGPLGARLGDLSQRFGHAAEAAEAAEAAAPIPARGARLTDTVAKLN